MFITDLLGEPVYPAAYDHADDRNNDYDDLVLVVRSGVPILKIVDALRLDPSVTDHLIDDGILDADLKLLCPVDVSRWEDHADLEGALIRLFAEQEDIDQVASV